MNVRRTFSVLDPYYRNGYIKTKSAIVVNQSKYQDLFNREMADEVLDVLGIELTRWFE